MAEASHSPLPHAPVLGLTHRLLGRFHVTGVFWYRFAYWGFTKMPAWTEWISVSFFATFFFLALGRIRGALASNLEPVLGPAGRLERLRRSYRTLWVFSWCFSERYRRLANPERFKATLEGEEHWRRGHRRKERAAAGHRSHRPLGDRHLLRGVEFTAPHSHRS